MQTNVYQGLSRYCPEDKYYYTACYLPFFTPLIFNNKVVAICGHYVCHNGYLAFSGELFTQFTRCNNVVDCYNGGVDEKYCTEEEEELFQCKDDDGNAKNKISSSRV